MRSTYRRNAFTWLAYILISFYGYFLNILGPLTPFLKNELALSYTVASLHFSAFAAGLLLAGLTGQFIIIRLGRWRSLWTAALGLSIGALVMVTGHHPAQTIAGSFVMGLVGSLIIVIVPAALSDQYGPLRAVALSEANVLSSLIGAAAPLLVGWLAAYPAGWRWALGGGALLTGALYLGFGKIEIPQAKNQSATSSRHGGSPTWFWIFWAALMLGVSVEFCLISWSADFLELQAGLSKANAAQAVSLFLAGMIFGRLASSRLVQVFPTQRVVIGFILTAGLGFGLFWLSDNAVWALTGLFISGLGVASMYPIFVSLSMEESENTVQAGARATIASGTAILALPLTLGRLADAFGIQAAYGIVGVLLFGTLVIAAAGERRYTRQKIQTKKLAGLN